MTAFTLLAKPIAKRGLHHIAATFGRHARRKTSLELLVLMYHRILPQNDERILLEEPGMTVAPETFRMHLESLREYFELTHLSDWLRKKSEGAPLPPKACAITFDDGWADNYEYAYPLLQETQAPATLFLVTDMIGTDAMFWPERLARTVSAIARHCPGDWTRPELEWVRALPTDYPFNTTLPSREQLSELINGAKSLSDTEIHDRIDRIERAFSLPQERHSPSLLDWDQVREMAASGLVEAGSHTCRHTRLNDDIPQQQLEKEIVSSKTKIEQETGRDVPTFCFPNGDYSAAALALVRQHYQGAVTTASGWNQAGTENHLLSRIGVHQDIAADRTAFLARLSGWI